MATDTGPADVDDREPDDAPDSGQAIEGRLRRMRPEIVGTIRLAAIPHRFNVELLSALREDAAGTDVLLEEMGRLALVRETASGWLVYHDILRSHLLAALQSQPGTYRQANARAADYFDARLVRPENRDYDHDLLEQIYHRLAADESAGLIQLRRHFDGLLRAGKRGLAQRLIDYAEEQQGALSQAGQEWVRYLGAQLGQASQGPELGQQIYSELAIEGTDPLLRAAAHRSLGEALARGRQWIAGMAELQTALRAFQRIGDVLEIANTQTALGLAFVSLAEAAGGLRDERPPLESRGERWLYALERAPFLAYRYLSRRFSLVPNLYFGEDYQNWIIARYLYGAIRWMTRADQTLSRVGTGGEAARSLARTYIHIRLADLRHRIGRWSRAERGVADLMHDPNVQGSPYLLGLVELGQGRALVAHGRPQAALEALRECRAILTEYGDLNNAGKAERLIGQACAQLGELEEASQAYRTAAEAFYVTDDLLNATEALLAAQTLAERLPAPKTDRGQAGELSEALPRQAYMERFPEQTSGSLHRLFRRLTTLLILPLAGLFIILLTLMLVLWFGAVELLFSHLAGSETGVLLEDLAAALPILLLTPLIATWIYEGLYAGGGALAARLLPLRWITRQQPVYLILDQQGLAQYDHHGQLAALIGWSQVTIAASLDRGIWRTPLTLFSRFLVGDQGKTLVVAGILNHYSQFKREVIRRLHRQAQPARMFSLDFSVLDRRWLLMTMTATVLLAGITILVDPAQVPIPGLSPSGELFSATAVGVVFRLWMLLIFVGPLFILIDWLRNRRAMRRSLGDRVATGPDWPIWLALFAALFATVAQVFTLSS